MKGVIFIQKCSFFVTNPIELQPKLQMVVVEFFIQRKASEKFNGKNAAGEGQLFVKNKVNLKPRKELRMEGHQSDENDDRIEAEEQERH